MPMIVVTAQVEDLVKWEEGFRTHADIFRSQTTISPVRMATSDEDNHVAVYFEVSDLDTALRVLQSQVTAEAMVSDGINRETVKVFVFDKEFHV